MQVLASGADDAAALGVADFKGLPQRRRKTEQGLAALELDPYREVALVYAPGVVDRRRQGDHRPLREACGSASPSSTADKGAEQRRATSIRATRITDTQYAAFYYPWIVISDPQTGARKLVPPGGHVLGVYARTDTERGVFKAPANEIVRGVLDLEYDINDSTQDDAESARRERHPQLPRPRHPRLGRAHADVERAVEVRERAAAVHLPRALDLRGHAVGGVRAERRRAVGARHRHDPAVPAHAVAAAARCSAAPRRRRSSSPATARR